jgi:hypothetical protein
VKLRKPPNDEKPILTNTCFTVGKIADAANENARATMNSIACAGAANTK